MSSKAVYYIAIFIGSTIGAYIPRLWGVGLISFSSITFSALGALAGFIIVWKWSN
jgi:predicted MFS family arabinose efflux permease